MFDITPCMVHAHALYYLVVMAGPRIHDIMRLVLNSPAPITQGYSQDGNGQSDFVRVTHGVHLTRSRLAACRCLCLGTCTYMW